MNAERRFVTRFSRLLIIAATFGGPAASVAENPDEKQTNARFADFAEQSRQRYAEMSFEEFEAAVFKEPTEDGVYIVNGDTTIRQKKRFVNFMTARYG